MPTRKRNEMDVQYNNNYEAPNEFGNPYGPLAMDREIVENGMAGLPSRFMQLFQPYGGGGANNPNFFNAQAMKPYTPMSPLDMAYMNYAQPNRGQSSYLDMIMQLMGMGY